MVGRRSALGSLVIASLLVIGCQGGGEGDTKSGAKPAAAAQDIGEVLATVNNLPIGSKEFDEAYARSVPRRDEEGEEVAAGGDKKQEVLDKLIADKLLYQEALRQGLDQDPRIQKMMVNSLLRKDVYGSIKSTDISEEELKAYFETHKDEFIVPEKVQVRRILIKVDGDTTEEQAKAKLEEIRAKVLAGAEFKDLAMENSEDPYARRGGDIGFISDKGKPGLDQAVVERAFATEKGQMSEVFRTEEGFNLIQVVNKRDRIERTFDQMKGAVLRKLKTEKYKTLYDDYVANLKKTATISVNDAALQAHKVEEPAAGGMGAPGGMPEGIHMRQAMPGGEGAAPLQPAQPGEGGGEGGGEIE